MALKSLYRKKFHGIWGDYDVNITLPKGYEVAATGILPDYKKEARKSGKWHFVAEDVIDFAWAADKDFVVITDEVDGIEMNFIYQNDKDIKENWQELPRFAKRQCTSSMNTLENTPTLNTLSYKVVMAVWNTL